MKCILINKRKHLLWCCYGIQVYYAIMQSLYFLLNRRFARSPNAQSFVRQMRSQKAVETWAESKPFLFIYLSKSFYHLCLFSMEGQIN